MMSTLRLTVSREPGPEVLPEIVGVLGANLLGDGLRDLLDPRLRQ